MASVQAGAALSTHLFQAVTPAGSAWLRLAIAALILLLVTRPRPRAIGWPALRGAVLLGVMTAVLTLAFIEAVARIPLGTASAIEFLGPLGVAAIGSHRRSALVWPTLALAGVTGLTEPWHGQLNLSGVGFAAVAALGWAGYILLTQRVGVQLRGLHGLAISLSTAALDAAPIAAWPALRGLTPVIAAGAGAGRPGSAAAVQLGTAGAAANARRRLRHLDGLEPAMAAVIGLLLLAQPPALWQIAGITLVVTAGIGAQRTGPPAMVKTAAGASRPAGPPALTAGHPTGHPGDSKTAHTTAAPGTDARRDLGQLAADQRPVLDELVLVDSGHETLRPSVRLAEGADAIGGHRQKFRGWPEAALPRGSGHDRRPPFAGETALRSRGVLARDVKTELRRAGLAGPVRARPVPPASFRGPGCGLDGAAWRCAAASPVTWARGWLRRGRRADLLVAACGLAGC